MPLYEYQCANLHVFEQVRRVEDRHDSILCPHCDLVGRKVILHPPKVFGDYEGYVSPASGQWVEGKRQRQEDMLRTNTRPYEEGEREHVTKVRAQQEKQLDAKVDAVVEQTLNDITL